MGPELPATAVLLALLVWAACEDLRTRRIPNWLTVGLAAAGLGLSFSPWTPLTPWMALAGVGVGLSLPLVLFLLGALGGGDVKLLAAVGAWLGPRWVLGVFAGAAVIGLILVLVQCALRGRLRQLLANVWLLISSLLYVGQLGTQQVRQMGQSARSVDKPLPYAVPVLLATAMALLAPHWAGRFW